LKPSNILLNTEEPVPRLIINDFSSAINEDVLRKSLFGDEGPTKDEITIEYAPPEVRLSSDPHHTFSLECPESYDAWSIGVIFLEFLLGTARVFEVWDPRTSSLIRHRLKSRRSEPGYEKLLDNTMLLAALGEFGIYPNSRDPLDDSSSDSALSSRVRSTCSHSGSEYAMNSIVPSEDIISNPNLDDPVRPDRRSRSQSFDKLTSYQNSMVCDESDQRWSDIRRKIFPTFDKTLGPTTELLRRAILRRDPLGLGFTDSWGLDLLSRLLHFNPCRRISLADALQHAYFVGPYISLRDGSEHATASDRTRYDELTSTQDSFDTESDCFNKEAADFYDNELTTTPIDSDVAQTSLSSTDFLVFWLDLMTKTEEFDDRNNMLITEDSEEFSASYVPDNISATFTCPKCGRTFSMYESCISHAVSRGHGSRCRSEPSSGTHLPGCLSRHLLTPLDDKSGWCDLQGRRPYIEDYTSVGVRDSQQMFSAYSVFDGHYGSRVARYLARHFHDILLKQFHSIRSDSYVFLYDEIDISLRLDRLNKDRAKWQDVLDISDKEELIYENIPFFSISVQQAIQALYQAIESIEYSLVSHGIADDRSGSTLASVLVFDSYIMVANIGDSRVVLCCDMQGLPIRLTIDHTPADPLEYSRVESSGGRIIGKGEMARVQGQLAITRAIGDFSLKPFISSEPDVLVFSRNYNNNSRHEVKAGMNSCQKYYEKLADTQPMLSHQLFIVVGSDGLWNAVSDDDACDIVCTQLLEDINEVEENQNLLSNSQTVLEHIAEILSYETLLRGSTDNIGTCIIDLHMIK
jgi:serine/threonine protein phosphatase PrpC/serine/threonine protein kinase